MENENHEVNLTDEPTVEPTVKNKKRIWPIIEGIVATLVLLYFDAGVGMVVLLWITNFVFLTVDRIKTPALNIILKISSFVLPLI